MGVTDISAPLNSYQPGNTNKSKQLYAPVAVSSLLLPVQLCRAETDHGSV